MTSRDTHDIEEYEKEKNSTNVQPTMLVKLMMEAEPCLFANKSEPVVKPYVMPPELLLHFTLCQDAMRRHAQEQIDFFTELFEFV
jgi:hypothetical protein